MCWSFWAKDPTQVAEINGLTIVFYVLASKLKLTQTWQINLVSRDGFTISLRKIKFRVSSKALEGAPTMSSIGPMLVKLAKVRYFKHISSLSQFPFYLVALGKAMGIWGSWKWDTFRFTMYVVSCYFCAGYCQPSWGRKDFQVLLLSTSMETKCRASGQITGGERY